MRLFSAAIAMAAAIASCATSSAPPASVSVDWPMFRGDLARDGHAPAATLTAAQAPHLQLAWRAGLGGAVDGSPVVSGGLVVAGSQGGRLAAYDAATGAQRWVRSGLGPISGTPAIDGGFVFAATLSGHVRAFHLSDGRDAWDWKAPGIQPALWSSPTIHAGLVLIGVGSQAGDRPLESGRVVALDAGTGRERWSDCTMPDCAQGGGIWSTPSIDSAGRAFVGEGNPLDGVLAFDAESGRRLWQYSFYADAERDLDIGASPVVMQAGDREVLAIGSVAGILKLLDAGSGAVIWSKDLVNGSAVHGLLATPAYDGTHLYVPSASPPTGLIALEPDGAIVWTHPTDQPVYSAPAVASGVVVFGTGAVFGDANTGHILAVSTDDARVLWDYDARSAVRSSPVLVGDIVLVGDSSGDLLAFRPSP